MDTKPCRWTCEEIWIVLTDTLGVRKLVVLDGGHESPEATKGMKQLLSV